jgi:MoxR-like ATPase
MAAVPELDPAGVAALGARIAENVARAVKVPEGALRDVLVALVAEGHVLIEDNPGVGKTALARALSRSTDAEYARIQCTADLLPADVVGTNVFNQREARFEFRPGPVFANVVLVDEINRASPKTQSGLLECMQERHVTVDVHTHDLARPFLVIATQNPIEYEGTYPLPEAQLDRFMLRVGVGYPGREDEWEVLERRLARATDEVELEPIVGRDELIEMQRAIEQVHVDRSVGLYMVDLVAATRSAPGIQVGASPRGSLALLKLSRCRAALAGRDFVIPEDVKAVAVPALAHRLSLRPELWVQRLRPEDLVLELLDRVPTPKAEAEPEPAAE